MNGALATGTPTVWFTRDRLTRFVVVLFFLVVESIEAWAFIAAIRATEAYSPLGLTRLFANACMFLFVAMMMGLTIVRDHPRLQAAGSMPRIAALLGTNLIMVGVFILPARGPLNIYESVASSVLILASNILCVYVLRRLGRSFSIMAEARVLVTDGPYALIRHPLYVVEEIGVVGVFIQLASWPAAMLFMTHFVFQLQRIRNEERVLTRAFPRQYRTYAVRTARLIPGVW
jgi:protein-S-isoprenylcysteine O-methyltransferase Ste14